MSFKDLIAKTHQKYSSPITKSILKKEFTELGIKASDDLIVHSSLSSLGYIAGGALCVIESLQEIVTPDGSISMPTHSTTLTEPMHWENPPIPEAWWPIYREEASAFDPHHTKSEWMGRIPELFRQLKDVQRSQHPAHSLATWGRVKTELLSEHPLTDSMGPNSPYGRLYDLNAKILLIGVDHDSNTSLHIAESIAGVVGTEKQGAPILKDGVRLWVEFEELCYDNDDFEDVGAAFEKNNAILAGEVGLAKCKLIEMKKIVDFATVWFKKNRKS